MKAPDKIYRTTTYLDNDKGKTLWKESPVKGAENVEYIRTDAFIEKASEWLCNNYHKYIRAIGSSIYPAYSDLCRDFQNDMKGE